MRAWVVGTWVHRRTRDKRPGPRRVAATPGCIRNEVCVWFAHEPLAALDGFEAEALAALPGGTGPGALTGAFGRTTTGPPGNGGSRGRGTTMVTAAFRCPPIPRGPPTTPGGPRPMHTTILGDGHLGWAVASAARRPRRAHAGARPAHRRTARSGRAGRRRRGRRRAAEATPCWPTSRPGSMPASAGSCSPTTGWATDRDAVEAALRTAGAAAVAAANFSLGVALFRRLVETAAELFGAVDGFDPYLVEWHRRGKVDRPSGTALELGRRLVRPAAGRRRRATTSRSSRSAPERRPGCTSSASTRPARPSSCG